MKLSIVRRMVSSSISLLSKFSPPNGTIKLWNWSIIARCNEKIAFFCHISYRGNVYAVDDMMIAEFFCPTR